MRSINDIHLFLENNLPEYTRRDFVVVCRFYLQQRKVSCKKPLAHTLARFGDFKKFIAEDWQGEEIIQPGNYVKNNPREPEHGRCPCGGFFVIRTNKKDGNKFLGCTNYPKCKNTATL